MKTEAQNENSFQHVIWQNSVSTAIQFLSAFQNAFLIDSQK